VLEVVDVLALQEREELRLWPEKTFAEPLSLEKTPGRG
jgi:hypothetical protein